MLQPLRIIFAGTSEFASCHLQTLLNNKSLGKIIAVYTKPDRPVGRGRKIIINPTKYLAQKQQIPVFQPENLTATEVFQNINNFQPDLIVVVAYGMIIPKNILAIPKWGCLNVHASLLPKLRGAAPIQRAIMNDYKTTGITIMQMNSGLDTGDILLAEKIEITEYETAITLNNKLITIGQNILIKTIKSLNQLTLKPQNHSLATYAHKITTEDARIDWNRSAHMLSCHIRGLNPIPVAWSMLNDKRIRIYMATPVILQNTKPSGTIINSDQQGVVVACGQEAIKLEQIQLPGKKMLPVSEILHSQQQLFALGNRFQ